MIACIDGSDLLFLFVMMFGLFIIVPVINIVLCISELAECKSPKRVAKKVWIKNFFNINVALVAGLFLKQMGSGYYMLFFIPIAISIYSLFAFYNIEVEQEV